MLEYKDQQLSIFKGKKRALDPEQVCWAKYRMGARHSYWILLIIGRASGDLGGLEQPTVQCKCLGYRRSL